VDSNKVAIHVHCINTHYQLPIRWRELKHKHNKQSKLEADATRIHNASLMEVTKLLKKRIAVKRQSKVNKAIRR
jgi:hypothetical protein